MLQDLRFGFKLLWKEKGFTITALLTLALCIGANTAIFTVLNAVILAPLPFSEPDRLVSMANIYPGVGVTKGGENSIPDYLDRRILSSTRRYAKAAPSYSGKRRAGRRGAKGGTFV